MGELPHLKIYTKYIKVWLLWRGITLKEGNQDGVNDKREEGTYKRGS